MKDKNKINIAIAVGFLAMGVGLRALNISVNPGYCQAYSQLGSRCYSQACTSISSTAME